MPGHVRFRKPPGFKTNVFAPHELAHMQSAIDAVCDELGVSMEERSRRSAIAERVMTAYSRGGRQPLNLVQAGLSETCQPHIGA